MGIPPLICAWREGIWPCPAWMTWPITTCWTCSGATSARSSAALIAVPPSSVASSACKAAAELADRRACGGQDHGLGHRLGLSGFGRTSMVIGGCSRGNARSPRVNVEATTDSPLETGADTIVVGVFDGEGVAHDVDGGALGALLESGEARREFKHLAVTHAAGRRLVLVGLGARERIRRRARAAGGGGRPRTGARAGCERLLLGGAPPRRRRRRPWARRGHAAPRLPVRSLQAARGAERGSSADRQRPPRHLRRGRAARPSSRAPRTAPATSPTPQPTT